MDVRKASVTALVVCAVSDLAAVPLLLGDVTVAVGVGVGVVAALTLVAAIGTNRRTAWSRPLALGTRLVDLVGALPAVAGGVGAGATSAAIVTVVLSVVAISLILRTTERAVRTV